MDTNSTSDFALGKEKKRGPRLKLFIEQPLRCADSNDSISDSESKSMKQMNFIYLPSIGAIVFSTTTTTTTAGRPDVAFRLSVRTLRLKEHVSYFDRTAFEPAAGTSFLLHAGSWPLNEGGRHNTPGPPLSHSILEGKSIVLPDVDRGFTCVRTLILFTCYEVSCITTYNTYTYLMSQKGFGRLVCTV